MAYGAVTGVTQTVRNFGGSLGLAVLGTILIDQNVSRVGDTLGRLGVPHGQAEQIGRAICGGTAGAGSGASRASRSTIDAVQLDFAHSTSVVVYVMAGVMGVAFLVALTQLPAGRVAQPGDQRPARAR